jgi:hypothetical protein
MATAQRLTNKSNSPGQFESFVERRLALASRRLRGLDMAAWALGLSSAVLAYGLSMSLADRTWDLSTAIRLTGWCFVVICLLVCIGFAVRQQVFRSVNPRFLARQLEQTVPNAKNSVVNWLDLRAEKLAPVIRGSLGRQAAKDLSHTDAQRALSAKPVWWIGSVAGCLLLVQLAWLVAAPGQARSLLKRAFFPFDTATIAARTQLTLQQPQGGDVAVEANKPVRVRVQVDGLVPPIDSKDSLRLHFRHRQNEPYEERALLRDVDGTWTTEVLADQVRNGFWYKITGGDARLPAEGEYRVDVRAIPQVLRFEAAFKYRPYLRGKDLVVTYDKNVRPSIRELRGTELTLTVHTNRTLKQCTLEFKSSSGTTPMFGEPVASDPEAWRFRWVLDRSGEYRILFLSSDGEENVDRQPGRIEVVPDRAPVVVMTKPAKDLSLPANGTLVVAGQASDDFGVKSMQLRLKVLKGQTLPELKPKLYRPEKSFQLVNGHYPLRLDYSDYVGLETLQTADGQPIPLLAGMELEYWIEARDNCDYPEVRGNLGQSARYKLTIEPPQADKKKPEQDRQQAQKDVQQDQQQQDKSINDQNAMAKEQGNKGGAGDKTGKDGQGQQDNGLKDKTEQVKNAMDQSDNRGEAKGAGEDKGGAKEQGQKDASKNASNANKNKPEQKNDAPKDKSDDNPGKGNDTVKKDNQAKKSEPAGKGKDQGPKSGDNQPSAASKGGDPKAGDTGSAKAGPQNNDKDQGAGAKGQQGADPGSELSKEKGAGNQSDPKAAQNPPDDIKNAKPVDDKGVAKDAQTVKDQVAGAKGGDPSKQQPPGEAKPGSIDQNQTAGQGKAGDRKDATMEDVAKLRDQLQKAEQSDQAKKALEKIGEQAKDPQVQDAAEKVLQEAKAKSGQPKDGGPPNSAGSTDKSAGTPGEVKDQNPATGKTGSDPKTDTGTDKTGDAAKAAGGAKSEPGKTLNGNPAAAKQGTVGPDDTTKGSPLDLAASQRAADLQLENLKNQIDKLRSKFTPDVMNKLKWTDAEREDYLNKVLAEELARGQQTKAPDGTLPPPGSLSKLLPGGGMRKVQRDGNVDPSSVTPDRPPAPPEIREALKIFQGKR